MNHLSNDPAKSYTVNNREFSVALCVGWRLPLPDYILIPTLNCHQNTNQRAKYSHSEAEEGRLEINFQGDVALFHTEALLCQASTDIIWFSFVCYNRINWYIASVYGDGFHKVICSMCVCVCSNLSEACWFGFMVWSVSPRALPDSCSPVLGLQLHTAVPAFHVSAGDGNPVLMLAQQAIYWLNQLSSLHCILGPYSSSLLFASLPSHIPINTPIVPHLQSWTIHTWFV